MKKSLKLAEEMMVNSVLDVVDAARLTLEIQESLGRRMQRRSRVSSLQLIRRVIQAGVKALEQEERTVTLETAAWASVEARAAHLRPVSLRDLRYYVRRLLKVEGAGKLPLRRMKTADCRRILNTAFPGSKSGYTKARAVLHSIFAYGLRQEWCDSNPVTRIDVPRVNESTIEPLTPEEVEQLNRQARGGDMQLSLHLMLYGGVRPAEVARLKPDDFCWKERVVIIRPQASKTGGGRVVPLRGCGNIPPRQRIIPPNWQRRWRELRHKAGFDHWVADSCRHTFATYHAAFFRNLPALQLEMGHHDLTLLRSRYVRPTSARAARKFWAGAKE